MKMTAQQTGWKLAWLYQLSKSINLKHVFNLKDVTSIRDNHDQHVFIPGCKILPIKCKYSVEKQL